MIKLEKYKKEYGVPWVEGDPIEITNRTPGEMRSLFCDMPLYVRTNLSSWLQEDLPKKDWVLNTDLYYYVASERIE